MSFISQANACASNGKGERKYLNDIKTRDFVERLNLYFQSKVKVPRIRIGKQQEIETLINEEALLFAKYLKNEKEEWSPRSQPLAFCSISSSISLISKNK